MYRILPLKISITALVVFGAGFLALILAMWESAVGEPVDWWALPRSVSVAGSMIIILLTILLQVYWKALWRWLPALNRIVFPDLSGTWRGELRPNWVDPKTNHSVRPKSISVIIEQTWLEISVRMKTDEAESFSNRVFLEREKGTHIFRIWYGYRHRPRPEYRPANPPHDGMAYLEYDAATARGHLRSVLHRPPDHRRIHSPAAMKDTSAIETICHDGPSLHSVF